MAVLVFTGKHNMSKNKAAKDPCWDGYEMIGMKKKGGKDVPNCVPVKSVNELLARINASSTNTVTLDIMLLTRLLEKAREDIKTDADLHFLVDAVFQAQGGFEDTILDMEVYDSIVNAHEKLRAANPNSVSSDL